MTHWERLSKYNSIHGAILDLGCGKGDFLIEAARHGADATGLEINQDYIDIAYEKAKTIGISIVVVRGNAENLPFASSYFDFVNVSEVIEHVMNPEEVLKEINRVLKLDGLAYLSVPNRFGFKDPHFHLFLVNWLPRQWADQFIKLFGLHKNYNYKKAGLQRLTEMHYYTYRDIVSLLKKENFFVRDIRKERLKNEFKGIKRTLFIAIYPILRTLYFDSFHLLIQKTR